MDDNQLVKIVTSERDLAIGYQDELSEKRGVLLDYYNGEPYGDEVEGRSKFVSSDVSDVVQGMLPSLLRVFTQGKHIGKFIATTPEEEREAEQKTELTNYVFMRQNRGVRVLHDAIKDALLQYVGVVKVFWDEADEVTEERYKGLSEDEKARLEADEEVEVVEESQDENGAYTCRIKRTRTMGKVCYETVPPEEFLINKDARNFHKPRFIGQRTPRTRSQLIEMGFDADVVSDLPGNEQGEQAEAYKRKRDINGADDGNPGSDPANDEIWLTECYVELDLDEDGITELWQVFEAGNVILEKNLWDEHPYACGTPIPIPHRAIGTCPADQAADLQFTKSVLVRQMLDNIYNTNYNRTAYNTNTVDLDDLLTPRPGGVVGVDGVPANELFPLTTQPIINEVLAGIEYMDTARETRTGVSRLNQGLDPETLNKTATGFTGLMNASLQQQDLIARVLAEDLVTPIFTKTANLLTKYQDEGLQVIVSGQPMEIDPAGWKYKISCYVDVGIGSGDRQEMIANLSYMLNLQSQYMQTGLVLADQTKVFNTLDKLVTEIGLKDANLYFNNPEVPQEIMQPTIEILTRQVQMLQQQVQQNPLAEAEMIKAQAKMAEVSGKGQADMMKFVQEMAMKDEHFRQSLVKDLTEMELKYNADVDGNGRVGNVNERVFNYNPATGDLTEVAGGNR